MVIRLRPCARCEKELPPGLFPNDDAVFCKRCTKEATELMARKYHAIEAAITRAKLRRKQKTAGLEARTG